MSFYIGSQVIEFNAGVRQHSMGVCSYPQVGEFNAGAGQYGMGIDICPRAR